MDEIKDCPYCGEAIKKMAIKCKHCSSMLINDNDFSNAYPSTEKEPNKNQYLFLIWIFGTVLVILSWFDKVDPAVGWLGFFVTLVTSTLSWNKK
jgi:hypothetical protein